jgi:hypothetical protein
MRIDPDFSLAIWVKNLPWKEGERRERIIEAMRKAGLK